MKNDRNDIGLWFENMVREFERTPSDKRKALMASWALDTKLDTSAWLLIHRETGQMLPQLKAFSAKRAFETAKALGDYVEIASKLRGNDHKHRAYEEILKFDITTDEDIKLLTKSWSVRLRHVGWYLAGRKNATNC